MAENKKLFLALAVFFILGTLIFAGGPKRKQLIDPGNPPKPYADGEVLVKFKKGVSLNTINNFVAGQSLKVKNHFKFLSKSKGQEIMLLKSANNVDALVLAKALSANPSLEYATPNYRNELAATPNDTSYSSLWGMNNTGQTGGTVDADIDAPEAWDIGTGSASVIVADIDTGFDYLHPDLAANAWTNPGEIAGNGIDDDGNGYIDDVYGIDAAGATGVTPDTDPMDGDGHGTHTAGTIGAVGNNALGVVGVNWNVKIMGLKFFDDAGGNAYDSFAITCIQYAVYEKQNHGQNVVAINASWGSVGGSDSGALRDAIQVANNAGIVFCAAVGNGGSDGVGDNNDRNGGMNHHYPSDYTLPGIIAVMATDHNDAKASFSNYGTTSVDLAAPGVSILSTVKGAYVPKSGDIFFDDMESGEGKWTKGGSSNWGTSTNQEGLANVNFPVPSPPTFWSDSPGINYVSNTDSWIINNTNINLTGYLGQKVYIGFGAAWSIHQGDHCYVQISNNGGTSWTTIHDQAYDGYVYYWGRYYGLIPDSFKTASFRIRLRLTADNDNATLSRGAFIDDIGIGTGLTYSYESWGGTSMACPHVAGAVGLMASVFPGETVAQRKSRILTYADVKPGLATYCVTSARLNLFNSISYLLTPKSISVVSPNGGESWTVGTSQNITWTSAGTVPVGTVNIDYSTDSGSNWTSVASNTTNDGTHSWTIPNTPSTTCLVRVQETDGSPTDVSNAVFTIAAATAETVSSPTTPSGPASGTEGGSYAYSTGGSTSSNGHAVQYFFDWGDTLNSGWLAVGTTSASHTWLGAGTYNVRAMARCSIHTTVESSWSAAFPVTMDETPTWVAVSCFEASAEESQPTVEWRTGTESGTVGFNLWRQDNVTKEFDLVNPSFLPSLPNSPQGGVYRLADPGAQFGEPVVYRLEEVDALGRTMSYGPFTVTFGAPSWQQETDNLLDKKGKAEPTDIYGYQRFQRARSAYDQERLKARQLERQRGAALAASASKERVRITVKGRGLFYVTSGQVASSLGISVQQAEALISQYRLSLSGMGKNIAWLADANGAGVFFYNQGLETIYSDRNVFWLAQGSGLAMETFAGGNAAPADAGQAYREALHFEGNQYALLGSYMNPLGDIWFWDYIEGGGGAKPFPVQVPGVAPSGTATLTVTLQGATDTSASYDHHAIVALNGREIGGDTWDGTKAHTFDISFNPSLLNEGANTISVTGALDMGAPYSIFYVESFDLRYNRYYKAVDNALLCRGEGNAVVTVSGFSESQAVVLDVSRPERPQQALGVVPDLSGRVTFMPKTATGDYLVSGLNAALRPLSVVGDQPADLKGPSHSAEYIVIAPEEFKETARQLAKYRQGRKLKSLVVTLEDIYEVFNFGVPSPYAIRDFLAHAYLKWGGKKVRYAVLAGKGTYDYNDYQGHGDNLVPAILAKTPEGLCAADKVFGDVKGKDGLPEIAIGRLPVVTNAELQIMIGKIKAYDGGQGEWADKSLWIADNADDGGDFAGSSNELASLATGLQAEKIYLASSAAETRSRIIASWNEGAALVNYFGHGAINQLAMENIFSVTDARSLQNGGRLPLAAMFTCVAGRFELPGYTSLGEALLLNADGGMAGGLLPSGAALNSDSLRLGGEFYRAAYRGKAESAGAALIAAMKKYLQLGGNPSLLNVYNWLGDPALAFK